MKIFTINPSDISGNVVIEEGAKLETFALKDVHDKIFYGLDLGYFRNDLDKKPEDRTRKYFLIHNHINISDRVTFINPCFKGEDKRFKQGNAILNDSTTDTCVVYLFNPNPRIRSKFVNAKDLALNNKLVSGCIRSDKVMTSRDGKLIQDECQPSVLIAEKDNIYVISFFDLTTKTNRLLTISFNGSEIVIISNEEKQRRAKKIEMIEESSINPTIVDFFLDSNSSNNRRNRKKSRHDRYDSDKWN